MESKEMMYFRLFREVCRQISSTLELSKILTLITENATKALVAKGCIIYLLDRRDKKLKISAHYGLSDAYIEKGPVDADKSIMASLQGEMVFICDAAKDERLQYPEMARKEGIGTILSIPMSVRGHIIGVLRIYTAGPRNYEEIEAEFAAGLADISSIAIENARMYSHLEMNHQKLINDISMWFDYGATS